VKSFVQSGTNKNITLINKGKRKIDFIQNNTVKFDREKSDEKNFLNDFKIDENKKKSFSIKN
jgi:hypothetical protein